MGMVASLASWSMDEERLEDWRQGNWGRIKLIDLEKWPLDVKTFEFTLTLTKQHPPRVSLCKNSRVI